MRISRQTKPLRSRHQPRPVRISRQTKPLRSRPPAEAGADFSALEAILDDMGDGAELEPDSPEFVRLRELCCKIEATYGAGRRRDDDPARGSQPDPARSDTPLARAEERFRRRQEELSRQIDAHYGINGERPEPVGPERVSERVEEVPP